MPYAIDEEKIKGDAEEGRSGLQQMDMNQPPLRQIAHQDFPMMVYLHPRDKSKEHRSKTVNSEQELNAAEAQGYRTDPHIPEPAPEDLSKDFDVQPVAQKRGPGRPPKTDKEN